ncbi:MAG TPA: AsmA-like C-terminal region-containing protein, partial [Hyphomicrobiaceae bacterium]
PGPRPPKASGPLTGRIEFTGRGVSPRAVVSALQGEGSVAFGDARLPGLAPSAVLAASEAALKAEPGKLAPTLRQTLAAGLGAGRLAVGQATVAVEIADGQVRSRPVVIDTSEGRASGTARLDLKGLKLDSQWRLEAKVPDGTGAAKPFPAVMVSYRAPVAALSSAELQIDTSALEQELAARKIEHDMEELERLRRLNEADHNRKSAEPPGPARPPAGPVAPIPPFGHEVRPDAPG